ncbi:hypothetical protein [Hymenobacter negativus]|uniref:Uncharacterized protein n=1 Tax=Hymenobacter negativus TaxID=2795026 RepID=A0ABS3QFV9_9BACT|nr:hypothetical protein [Hymenobacter negativus]MBO2009580.1 hypothetical protein [Hymenobacter negativus]
MNTANKIVASIPLENIWTDESELPAKRIAYLTSEDIVQLLKKSIVHFIVADVGHKLQWIDKSQCFNFWKQEAKPHIADDVAKIDLATYVDNYAYVASQWATQGEAPIITLEKFH